MKRENTNYTNKGMYWMDNKENIISTKSHESKNKRTKATLKYQPQKTTAQLNALRLRNCLLLDKAIKVVFHEWFYSNIDRPLLLGENDFRAILKEKFPNLKTRLLTKGQWSCIRKIVGRPRLCSSHYFRQERSLLNQRRNTIRKLQRKEQIDPRLFNVLPDDFMVPGSLFLGTPVLARANDVKGGITSGVINAIDIANNCYLIECENSSRLIPDDDVISLKQPSLNPISTYKTEHKTSRHMFVSSARYLAQSHLKKESNAMKIETIDNANNNCKLCSSDLNVDTGKLNLQDSNHFGGFPMRFLVMVARLSKLLIVKNNHIEDLRKFNNDAQWMVAVREPITPLFQYHYTNCVIKVKNINYQIQQYMVHVIQFANEIATEKGFDPLEQPYDIIAKSDIVAMETIMKNRNRDKKLPITAGLMNFIQKAVSSLIQIHILSEQVDCSYDFCAIRNTVSQMKDKLSSNNKEFFIDHCEAPLNTIITDLDKKTDLSLFLHENPLLIDDNHFL